MMDTLAKKREKITYLRKRYRHYHDPWGTDIESFIKTCTYLYPLYSQYFKVSCNLKKNLKNQPYMVIANHSGQIAIDGILATLAFFWELDPPIMLHSMMARFLTKVPFLTPWLYRNGSVLGDRKNCELLLSKGESILTFPEGTPGVVKNTGEFYQLRNFSTGFLRMAIKMRVPIVPVSIVGVEELYPIVWHFKKITRFFNMPSLPITPTFPLLGPLGLVPLPSPIFMTIGEPILPPKNIDYLASEKKLQFYTNKIRNRLTQMIDHDLNTRREQTNLSP